MNKMLLSAAWFNWLVAFSLIFFPIPFFNLVQVTPLPTEPVFIHFFCALVFLFGIGYYWTSKDPVKHRSILELGAIGKLILVSTGCIDVAMGYISWQLLIPLSGDLIYGVLFFRALKQLS